MQNILLAAKIKNNWISCWTKCMAGIQGLLLIIIFIYLINRSLSYMPCWCLSQWSRRKWAGTMLDTRTPLMPDTQLLDNTFLFWSLLSPHEVRAWSFFFRILYSFLWFAPKRIILSLKRLLRSASFRLYACKTWTPLNSNSYNFIFRNSAKIISPFYFLLISDKHYKHSTARSVYCAC